MKINAIVALMLILSWLGFMPQASASAQLPTTQHDIQLGDAQYQTMILQYVNEYRAKKHLPPLKLIDAISLEAAKHSRDMANKTVGFGHQHFETRIKHLYKEIKDCRSGAENVAYYKLNAKKLVDAWVASPGHRRNIEGRYNVTGIGIAHGKTGWAYYTQIFLRTDDPRYRG